METTTDPSKQRTIKEGPSITESLEGFILESNGEAFVDYKISKGTFDS